MMIPLLVVAVGAWAQWKAYRWLISLATKPVTSKEVGAAFQDLAERDPDAMAAWVDTIRPGAWDATGELPVIRAGHGAIDTQPRFGET